MEMWHVATNQTEKKINSFHATYPNSPHVHLLDLPLYGGFFLSEHLFYILDKLIIITLFNFTRLNTPPFLVFELGMLNFDGFAYTFFDSFEWHDVGIKNSRI